VKEDSQHYKTRKAFFDSLVTLYGRNVVMEVLQEPSLTIHKLHLSTSNRPDGVIAKMVALAKEKKIEIAYHDKAALSRISKNAKQDQGVAIDIVAENYRPIASLHETCADRCRLLALDGIQNPQNLGMIIRSAAAGTIDGIILPLHNSAKISPLVIKASAGTLFKIPIFTCKHLDEAFEYLQAYQIYMLSSHAKESLFDLNMASKSVFVLGNESEGVSEAVAQHCNNAVQIPMRRGVESLNVAVTAALIAFLP
jgi:23S rRNA (guanosine2251-2'-O)-methyltransferase